MKSNYQKLRKETYRININSPIFYQKIGKYTQIMDLMQNIGFVKQTEQINTAFNFVKDPETYQGQEEIWRQTDINFDTEVSRQSNNGDIKGDSIKTNDLMNQYQANNRGIPKFNAQFYKERNQ